MTSRQAVDDFLAQHSLGLVGASRSGKKFGNGLLRALRDQGRPVIPVHPEVDRIDGMKTCRSIVDLPEETGGLILCVKPTGAAHLVREAAEAGIRRVWIQQGGCSDEAVRVAGELGVQLIRGECLLMFAEPVRHVHRFHRWVWGLLGKLPVEEDDSGPSG